MPGLEPAAAAVLPHQLCVPAVHCTPAVLYTVQLYKAVAVLAGQLCVSGRQGGRGQDQLIWHCNVMTGYQTCKRCQEVNTCQNSTIHESNNNKYLGRFSEFSTFAE